MISRFRRSAPLVFLLVGPAALLGCAQSETAKGDTLKIEKRTLAKRQQSFRLERVAPGRARLVRVSLCPVQERKIYEEVKIQRQPVASAVTGVTCGIYKFFEISNFIYGREVVARSDCSGATFTDRRPTGERIAGQWKTRLWQLCGKPEPLPAGKKVQINFRRSGEWKEYTLGEGGVVRFGKEDLRKMRLYLTVLRDVEFDVRYGRVQWRQKIDLE